MPKQSITKHTLPRDRRNYSSLPAQSKMCWRCGKITGGRHEGAHYMVTHPHDYHYIDEEGIAYNEEERKAMGQEANVSHGMCQECTDQTYTEIRTAQEARLASERGMKAAEEELRSAYTPVPGSREPIAEAYMPVPGSREPIAEAYEPVPGSREPLMEAYKPATSGNDNE